MEQSAWCFHEYGGAQVLRLERVPVPVPAPDEVLVKVRAAGLNRSDLLWTNAAFFKPRLPARIGAEICGVIETCGQDVAGFAPGDRVTCLPIFTRGAAHAYSHFAQYAVIPAEELIHTPDSLSDAQGAAFLFTGLTQMCALTETVQLRAGQTLLVTAGTSANGLSAIHLGRHVGARVIATTRSLSKRQMLLDAGAHAVVATGDERLSEAVHAITNGQGADVVYDCVGGALTNEIVKSLRPGGEWIMYGFLDPSPFTSDWPTWFAHQPVLHIYSLTQYTGLLELGLPPRWKELRRAIEGVRALSDAGKIPVSIARTFTGIETIADAFRRMEEDHGGGKIVVEFSD